MKIICKICGREFSDLRGLSNHIQIHKIKSYNYYETFLKKETDGICLNYGKVECCKKDTRWVNMSVGYHKYCSPDCYVKSDEFRKISSESKLGDKHWLKREGSIHPNKGKTYEEIHGEEKAKRLKNDLSILGKGLVGDKNPFFNHQHSKKVCEIFRNNKLGKSYEEMYGEEKAKEIKLKQKAPWANDSKYNYNVYTNKYFNKSYREKIIKDQNYECSGCSCSLVKHKKHLHHINFIKSDDRRENLIYLCPTCHGRTKNRETFSETIKFLTEKNKLIILESGMKGLNSIENKKIKN